MSTTFLSSIFFTFTSVFPFSDDPLEEFVESTDDLPWSFRDEGLDDFFAGFSSSITQSTPEIVAIDASSPEPEYPESDLDVRESEDFDLALEILSPFDELFCFCLKSLRTIWKYQ